jgi:hypothetical protein
VAELRNEIAQKTDVEGLRLVSQGRVIPYLGISLKQGSCLTLERQHSESEELL